MSPKKIRYKINILSYFDIGKYSSIIKKKLTKQKLACLMKKINNLRVYLYYMSFGQFCQLQTDFAGRLTNE